MFLSKVLSFLEKKPTFLAWLLIFLALLMRLPLLNSSFWLDEAAQVLESSRPFNQQLQIADDFQPPLLHLLTFFSIRLGSIFALAQSEWWLRFWGALLPSLIGLLFAYKISRQLFGQKVAVWTSLLLTTSSLQIFFSQELRPYSLAACFAMLSSWSLLQQSKGRGSILAFALFSLAGLYSTYVYPFFFLSQLLIALYFFRRLIWAWQKKYLLAPLLILLGYLPWLPSFWQQLQTGQALRQNMPGWDQVVSFNQIKTLVFLPLKFIYGVSDLELSPYFLLTSLLILLFLALSLKNAWPKLTELKHRSAIIFTLAHLLLPLLLGWLLSFFVPVLQPKRLLFLLPFFYLQIVAIVELSQKKNLWAKALLPFLLIINLISTWQYWTRPALQREDWRSLVAELNQLLPAERSIALFAFEEPFAPWRYYQAEEFSTLTSNNYDLRQLTDPAEHFKSLTEYDSVVVFDYLRNLTDPEDQLPNLVKNFGYQESIVLDYPNIGFVRIYVAAGQNLAGEKFNLKIEPVPQGLVVR